METKKQKILIVDDGPLNIKILGAVLREDYAVTIATDGKQAIDIAVSEPAPDLILLDIVMPEMDGYETCRQLKSDPRTQDIPVIFISVKGDEADEMHGLELGAVDYISKPFSMPIVLTRVQTHLTLRKTLQDARDQQEHLHAVINHAMDGIIHIDELGTVCSFNPAAETIFGYGSEAMIGENIRLLMPDPDSTQHDGYLQRYLETKESRLIGNERIVTALRSNGERFPLSLSVNLMQVKGKGHFIGIVRDITEKVKAEAKIRQLAHFDSLTELPNRALFLDRMQQSLRLAQRNKGGFSLLFIDLDDFKPINDTHGHKGGDQVLKQVADRLRQAVREVDTVARLGGDEFIIILSDMTEPKQAATMAEKILEMLAQPITINGTECCISASIGIAIHPADGDDIDALINRADSAMYAAKKAGKHRFLFDQQ